MELEFRPRQGGSGVQAYTPMLWLQAYAVVVPAAIILQVCCIILEGEILNPGELDLGA